MCKTKTYHAIKSISYILIILVLQSCFSSKLTPYAPPPKTLIVDNKSSIVQDSAINNTSRKVYTDIQAAIEKANWGDTIFIKEGIYKGGIKIKKSIHIIGESPEKVLLLPEVNNTYTSRATYGIEVESYCSNLSFSSIQIRNFTYGIKFSSNKNIKISNCIINSKTTLSISSYVANIIIQNSTLIGEIYISRGSVCHFKNNICFNDHKYYDVININGSLLDKTPHFTKNVIYGSTNFRIDSSNIIDNPKFESINNNNYLSSYTSTGYGAKVSGKSENKISKDNTAPSINFSNSIFQKDTIFIQKSHQKTKITVSDKSPIKKIRINSDDLIYPKKHHLSAFKYNYTIERDFNYSSGFHNLTVLAEDFYGNEVIAKKIVINNKGSKSNWDENNKITSKKIKTGKKYAIVMGVDKYEKPFTPLDYTLNDSEEIKLLLEKLDYKVFYFENPDRAEMIKAFKDLYDIETSNDKIVIYYSGHGSNKPSILADGNGFILPNKADNNNLSATALAMSHFRRFIKKLDSESVTILLDMCFAGGGKSFGNTQKSDDSNKITNKLISGRGKVILASSGDFEISREDHKLKHGVFTYYLLEAINNGIITIDDVYNYVYLKCKSKCNQKPRKIIVNEEVDGIKPLF